MTQGRPKGQAHGATRRKDVKIKHYAGTTHEVEKINWRELADQVDRGFRRFFFKRDLPLPHIADYLAIPVEGPHDVSDAAAELFSKNQIS